MVCMFIEMGTSLTNVNYRGRSGAKKEGVFTLECIVKHTELNSGL